MLKLRTCFAIGFATLFSIAAAPISAHDAAEAVGVSDGLYGLRFTSHNEIKDNRTSLCLTPRSGLKLGRDFALSFDVRFAEAMHTFGYVFRMVMDGRVSLDMVSNMEAGNPSVVFTYDNVKLAEFVLRGADGSPAYDEWHPVEVRYDNASGEIAIYLAGQSHSASTSPGNHSRVSVWFGACDHPDYATTDVPPMDVRDVRVAGNGGRELRRWRLGIHDGSTVWDDAGTHPAEARNPEWIIDGYAHWRRRVAATIPVNYMNMAVRADSGVVYFAADDRLVVYDNAGRTLDTRQTQNRLPFSLQNNQMIHDPVRDRLVCYDLDSRGTTLLPLSDPSALRWSETGPITPIPRYAHHNAAYVPQSDLIVIFGGYGEHSYKSALNTIGPDGTWSTRDLRKTISPHYLGGMAVADDGSLIVAGGYGSASGLQSESPRNFYDLWRIDPVTAETRRLGEIEREGNDEHFVLGRDMVLSDDGKTAYTLLYSDKRYTSEITLAGVDLATGRVVRYADAVPYNFSDIESFCTLAFDRKRDELLLVTTQCSGGGETAIEVWSLEWPMLQISETVQVPPSLLRRWWWAVVAALVLVGAAAFAVVRHIGRIYRNREIKTDRPAPFLPQSNLHKTFREDRRSSSILLLGGFRVIDRQGEDITGHFAKTVKDLFLLILLETYRNGRGISSSRLKDILWLDKDADGARNNRNVNIYRLRGLLQQVGRAEITCENSYWKLELGDDIQCDYSSLLQLYNEIEREIKSGAGCDREKAAALVALAASGKLLPNTHTEWSDEYKAEFTSRLMELLTRMIELDVIKNDPSALLAVADTMLVHDNLDEDAMRVKCGALVRMGKKHKAQEVYETFAKSFKKVLDADPDFKFRDIL